MKILHLTERFRDGAVGGAQVSVDLLATAQAEQGHDVTVVSMSDSPTEDKVNEGLRSIKLPLRPAYRSLRHEHLPLWKSMITHICDGYLYGSPRGLSATLDKVKPDVVHSHVIAGFSSAIWKSARDRGATVIHTIRDYYILCARSTCYKHGAQCETICCECKLLRYRAGLHTEFVHAVVGISQFILDAHIKRRIFQDTCIQQIIPNSVSLTRNVKPANGSRKPGVTFGFLGRLVELKGIWALLRAFKARASEHDRLFIAGQGSESALQRLMQISDARIQFLGYRDPYTFFNEIDILVVPSLWEEPFGRTAAESLRCGVPVLASKRGGVPEILSKQELGILFEPGEANSLENGISLIRESFLANRYDPFVIAKHGEMYSPERICQRYNEVYEAAVQGVTK